MAIDKNAYNRKYNRERQIRVYPETKDLSFIRQMQQQRPSMSKSAVAKYLIGIGVKTLISQKNL